MGIPIRVEIGFGAEKDRHSRTIHRADEKIARILALACDRFGGGFLIGGQGVWKSPKGDVVKESGYVLRIDNVSDGRLNDLRVFAADVRIILDQESVVFSTSDVTLEFV